MYSKIIILLMSLSCMISSCKNGEREQLIAQAREAVIRIPIDSLVCLHPRGDIHISNHVANADYRYVVYCDSSLCSLCELQRMSIWNGIIQRADESGVAVDYMFIFNPPKSEVEEFIDGYYFRKFNLTILVDTTGIVQKNNPILNNPVLHSFLLDSSNRIVKIGDASKNSEVEQEFYKFLKKVI